MTRFAIGLAVFLVLAIGITVWSQSEPAVETAERLLREGNFDRATGVLVAHIDDSPDDGEAVLLLAEVMQADPTVKGIPGTEKVIEVLDKIPDSAPEGLTARLQQAELSIQFLHEAQRAENYARRALEIAPNDSRCSGMMSYIFQLTRRFMVGEEYYDTTYHNTLPDKQIDVLRRWFLSQFDSVSMNQAYDEGLGLEINAQTDLNRFGSFIFLEPTAPAPRAALAAHYLDRGTAPEAVDVLLGKDLEDGETIDRAHADSFYAHQLIRGLLFLGEIEQAEKEFAKWSYSQDGHLYHRTAALIAEQSAGDFKTALTHYEEAAKFWPAPLDSQFHALHAGCLRKNGQNDAAKVLEERNKKTLAFVTNPVVQRGMQNAADLLPKPQAINAFAKFYEEIGRKEDAKRWLKTLETSVKAEVRQPPINEGF